MSTCCTVPTFPFSYKKIPVLRIAPFVALASVAPPRAVLSPCKVKSVETFCRQIAPTPLSESLYNTSLPFSSLHQIFNFDQMESFSSIQPLPSSSYRARSANPSPFPVPNSSLPSLMMPSSFYPVQDNRCPLT